MLLHGDGTNGAQNNTFIDSSTNNFTITRNGNTTQGSFSPYGDRWSNYFDGSGDNLSVPDNAALELGSGDFTLEFWCFWNGNTASQVLWTKGADLGAAFAPFVFWKPSGSTLVFYATSNGTSWDIASGVTLATMDANQWSHYALVRSGTAIKFYKNGVEQVTITTSASFWDNTQPMTIGSGAGAVYSFSGYISNLRIVKGTALYTGAFTPSTTPLTAVSGTQLLTCQSNRFIDNSSNNFTLTPNGNVAVTPFSPFAPSAAYSPAVNGGSGYFDGSGDFLSIAASSAFTFGTNDFCIEAWAYANIATGTIFSIGSCFGVIIYPGAAMAVVNNSGFTIITDPNAFPLKQWVHVAYTRSSNTVRLFINGVLAASGTDSGNYTTSGTARIGLWLDGANFGWNGYISNLRVVKGSAVYTAAFTPPTSPVTAITNTQLLCNMTNGAIFDNAMMNDLETVGNAQISTSVKKYGTGSLAFDGSGDYLKVNKSLVPDLFSGDYTIEFWMNVTATSGYQRLFNNAPGTTPAGYFYIYYNGSNLYLYNNDAGTLPAVGSFTQGQWVHVAISRSGSTSRVFINGSQTYSYTGTTVFLSNDLYIGGGPDVEWANGYIDDFRFTKGYARYTANFTPPTAAFPNQ